MNWTLIFTLSYGGWALVFKEYGIRVDIIFTINSNVPPIFSAPSIKHIGFWILIDVISYRYNGLREKSSMLFNKA